MDIAATADGNLLIVAQRDPITGMEEEIGIHLLKLNTDGDTIWAYGYTDSDEQVPYQLMETQNGDFVLTGVNYSSPIRQAYLLRITAAGEVRWARKIKSMRERYAFATIELPNGDLMTCGNEAAENYKTQLLLIKTNAEGQVLWEKQTGEEDVSETGRTIAQNNDGTLTIAGYDHEVNTKVGNRMGVMLWNIDQDGNERWSKRFNHPEYDRAYKMLKGDHDDNLIIGLYGVNGEEKTFLTITDSLGNYK